MQIVGTVIFGMFARRSKAVSVRTASENASIDTWLISAMISNSAPSRGLGPRRLRADAAATSGMDFPSSKGFSRASTNFF